MTECPETPVSNSPRFDVVGWVRANTWWMKGACVVLATCGSAWLALFWQQQSQGQAIAAIQRDIPQIKQQLVDQQTDLAANQKALARDLAEWRWEAANRERTQSQLLTIIQRDIGLLMGRTERNGGAYSPPAPRPNYGEAPRTGSGG